MNLKEKVYWTDKIHNIDGTFTLKSGMFRVIKEADVLLVVAELRKLTKKRLKFLRKEEKNSQDDEILNQSYRGGIIELELLLKHIDELFGCEKPMKDTTQEMKALFRSSVVGSQNPNDKKTTSKK